MCAYLSSNSTNTRKNKAGTVQYAAMSNVPHDAMSLRFVRCPRSIYECTQCVNTGGALSGWFAAVLCQIIPEAGCVMRKLELRHVPENTGEEEHPWKPHKTGRKLVGKGSEKGGKTAGERKRKRAREKEREKGGLLT